VLFIACNNFIQFQCTILTFANASLSYNLLTIYPDELEIKYTIVSSTSASYLDILLKIDASGKLTTLSMSHMFSDIFFHTNT
jgi:hypothetical protein